jgi:hypothetical protein
MGKGFALFSCVLALLLFFGSVEFAAQEPQPPEKINKDQCLMCHGPFDKIIEKNIKFKFSEEETINPHRYIPHDGQEAPECTECHTPHKIPLEDKSTVVRPNNVEFCLASCHHMRNFQPCTACH